MKILALSDIHGDLNVYRNISELVRSSEAEAVVLAGDLLGSNAPEIKTNSIEESQKIQSDEIRLILKGITVPLLYIMGNDDMIQWNFEDYPFHSIHQKSIRIGNIRFLGYQNTPPFMGGIHEKPEEDMQRDFEELQALVQEDDILITHGPAAGILDMVSYGEHVGSPALRAFIEQSKFRCHIHGHIHESFGRQGNTFNVAVPHSTQATLIDLQNLKHEHLMIA